MKPEILVLTPIYAPTLAALEREFTVLVPHIGSTTREVREERGRKLLANLRAHFSGKPVLTPLA